MSRSGTNRRHTYAPRPGVETSLTDYAALNYIAAYLSSPALTALTPAQRIEKITSVILRTGRPVHAIAAREGA